MDQIHEAFEDNKYTLGALIDLSKVSNTVDHNTLRALIDLSKVFNTVDHNILSKKIEMNGIVSVNLKWLENYLTNKNILFKLIKKIKPASRL